MADCRTYAKYSFVFLATLWALNLRAEEIDAQTVETKSAEKAEDTTGKDKAKKEKPLFSVTFTSDISRNNEPIDSVGQNAYASFKLLPRFNFGDGWSVGVNLGANQRIKPHYTFKWSDVGVSGSTPAINLGADFSLRFAPNLSFPTSDFSRDDLQMTFGAGVAAILVYEVSKKETWALNSISYSLGYSRKFYRYKTDIAGEPVTETIVSHSLGFGLALFRDLSFEPSLSFDSEFRSSGKIFNALSFDATLSYAWAPWLSTYASVSNSADTYAVQQRYGRLVQLDNRDTQYTVGAALTY